MQLVIVDVANDRIESTIPTNGSAEAAAWSHDGKRIAYMLVSTAAPGEIHTVTVDGGRDVQVTKQQHYSSARLVRYASPAGVEIPAYLYEPKARANKTAPALIWIHGGEPGTAAELDSFVPEIHYFVDHGFVVIAPNYRGSIGFGDKVARYDAGDASIPDIAAAAKYLATLNTVDPVRIAVIGFSFGGYTATLAAARIPEAFRAVVDFFGPTDWAAMYRDAPRSRTALRLGLGGTPEERPEVYRAASPVSYAEAFRAPILVLHGNADKDVPFSQSEAFAAALRQAGKKCELVTIPGAGHGFRGANRVRAFEKVMEFLRTALDIK